MAHIQLLGTGGTIASRSHGIRGAVATDTPAALVPTHYGDVTVRARGVLTTGSYRLDLADLRRIAEAVGQALADPGTDGVVVTHGTDTLEETAFLLDLVHASPKPVVLTGAQRTADSPDADGPRNVAEAVRAAADEHLRGAGALICFNGAVRSARGARKVHTTAGSPFGGGTPVGHMVGDQLVVPTYGNGGGIDLVAAGAIPSGDLNPFQARILAAVLLSYGTAPEEFPEAFETYR